MKRKKKHLYVCLTALGLLLGCHHSSSAENGRREAALLPLPRYAFIKYDDNRLQFPAGRTCFDSLYQKIDSLRTTRQGKVRILHIGGSHVQAGHMSHRLRTDFAALDDSIMSERGIMFPFRLLKTNAPAGYLCQADGTWTGTRCVKPNGRDTLGLSGAAVSTADPDAALRFTLNPGDSTAWRFTRLRIMGYASDSTSRPYALLDGDTLEAVHDAATRTYCINFPESRDSASLRFHIAPGGWFTLTGILPENDESGIVYHAVGINGADVPAWLRCAHLSGDLKTVPPDLVLFGIGINDANVPPQRFDPERFKARYRKLIAQVKAANPHCALLFITNNDCLLNLGRRYGKQTNPNTAKVAKAFKELAAEYDGAVWDQYHIMGGSRSSALWRGKELMRPDRIHFTAAGYRLIADLLYNAIITDYLQSDGNER